MRHPSIRPLLVVALLAGFVFGTAATAQRKRPFLAGICYTVHDAQQQQEKKVVEWVTKNRIRLVAIDFFGIAHSYDRIDFRKISRLVKRLKKAGVTVLADYRTSTSKPGVAHRGENPDLCLSNPEVRANLTGWGIHLLDKCPDFDILTIYNPLPTFERNKNCRPCKKAGSRMLLKRFFEEWSTAIRKRHPRVKLGAVFPADPSLYRALAKHLDVFCPFCSLIAPEGETACGPGVMKRVARDMRALRKVGPVIPLVKLYWKQATRNTTDDILHAMSEAKRERLDGFFLWYRTLLTGDVARNVRFPLPTYDLEKIEERYRALTPPKR